MAWLDRALVSAYSLSIVTTLLTEAVWPQFTTQVFESADSTFVWATGVGRESKSVPQGSG